MLKVGIIGAGTISKRHIESYQANPHCEVVAISDVNPEQAKKQLTSIKSKIFIPTTIIC